MDRAKSITQAVDVRTADEHKEAAYRSQSDSRRTLSPSQTRLERFVAPTTDRRSSNSHKASTHISPILLLSYRLSLALTTTGRCRSRVSPTPAHAALDHRRSAHPIRTACPPTSSHPLAPQACSKKSCNKSVAFHSIHS